MNPIYALRLAEDYANAVDCVVGECPYQVFLTTISDAAIDIDTLTVGVPTPIYTRVTIADGYRAYLAQSPSDGYLYPQINEQYTAELLASQQVLTTKQIILGPLVLPYTVGVKSGGLDSSFFAPPKGSTNIQYWINLRGPGVLGGHGQGSFYDLQEIKLDAMNNINYYLILVATATNPPGT